ncbi:hypothetical protein BU24DRAFT_255360 [Aaosphaeria arxii CBS 175.79]|uniref:Protein kinase domain-containing protein n=1 Tax=Aaosphaeria arxii CBS 175.79 TaxID=1450172 RepID=A0A6A5XHA9_9PLEO|nr:uncharacterized protein BU24DRAFT_255360 [Aaosphaeria arxii CBS 175.79]KAF2012598.1 hypothetical protein BU24DRAFT_255360 [Aaosphaeria arxii CBS 175.79]
MIFKKPLTNAMDIWEVACIIWWVATGDDLFYSRQNNREIIPQIHAFLGSSCADWLLGASIEGIVNEIWTTAPTPVDFDVREMVPLEQELKDLLSDDEDDEYDDFANYTEQLGKFMRRMLVVDPKQRPTAEELLEDEFLREKKTVGA